MSVRLVKNANFGSSKTGKVGSIGYSLYDSDGTITGSRATDGIYEVVAGSGLYGVKLDVSNAFSGSIVWDVESIYAVDEVDASTIITRQLTEGRWKIDTSTKQMIFYKTDNTTEIARYDLKDENGTASYSSVFDRQFTSS